MQGYNYEIEQNFIKLCNAHL